MSDQPEYRRISRRDRKRKIEMRGSLFPPEDDTRFAPPELQPDSEATPSPESQAETPDIFAEDTAEEERLFYPERFPPLSPETEASPSASHRLSAAKPEPAPRRSPCLYNLLTALFLLASVAVCGLSALIYANPYTPLNPFPPFTPLPVLITATFLPPTVTPPPTAGPTATFTPLPVDAQPTASAFAFTLANDGAVYVPNSSPEGCDWSSIAGTVTDSTGAPLDGYRVRIVGDDLDETLTGGSAPAYGPGGFELVLGDAPQEAAFTVQLLDSNGEPVSPEYTVTTQAACESNVAVLGFVENTVQ